MLILEIPKREFYDAEANLFVDYKKETLQLEHSLVSLSKWESNWCKPFLSTTEKTYEETIDYIKCMTITQNVSPNAYLYLPPEIINQVDEYINKPMTATWFSEPKGQTKSREIVTAELIYYWMIALTIPIECQKWHLNRLLTLIRVCNIKNQPPKKQGRKESLSQRAALNQARRQQHNTKG